MIAPPDVVQAPSAQAVTLPIHPAVTLESWVGVVHAAIADDALSQEQADALMAQIDADPDALRCFAQACRDEELISSLFAASAPAGPESEPVASPIW